MKCPVTMCPVKLKTKDDLKRHLLLIHGWGRSRGLLIALVLLGMLFLPACTDMGRVMFGPDVHNHDSRTDPWPQPDCVNLTTEQCCNLNAANVQMCQTLHIGGY